MDQNVSRQFHSAADEELLSAYIDGQLSAAERLTVERRLASDAALKAELEALQATVGLLRELQPVMPPRSFILDPATLPRQRWALFAPLRLATALVAVLLALTFTPDLFGGAGGNTGGAPMAAPAAEAPAAAGSATSGPEAALEAAPQAQQATAAAAEAAREAPAAASEAASEAAPAQDDAPVTTQSAPEIAESAGSVTSNAPPPADEVYRSAEITASDTSSPDTRDLPRSAFEAEGGLPWWRWAQIVLAGLTLALGAATLWARTHQE
jgi:anti-sigma factor RsiW